MRRTLGLIIAMLLALSFALPVIADHGTPTPQGNCPVAGKVEANGGNQSSINNTVLAAGTHVCIKGGQTTVFVTADGESTLKELLGTGQDVSHYTIIQQPTTTTSSSSTTSSTTSTTVEDTTTTTTVPEETTTTTVVESTTTTVPVTTSTTEAPSTTTTTVRESTTTTTPRTSSTAPESSTTTTIVTTTSSSLVPPSTTPTTTVATLPFTGIQMDLVPAMAAAGIALAAGVGLITRTRKSDESVL